MNEVVNDRLPLDILFVENDSLDQMAFRRFVRQQDLPYQYTIVSSPAEAQRALKDRHFDVILLDYQLDHGSAFDIFEESTELPVPFILMTGSGAEDVAVKALKLGAADYLVKDDRREYLQRIPTTIENAIRTREAKTRLRRAQVDANVAGVVTCTPDGVITDCNDTFAAYCGFENKRQLLQDHVWLTLVATQLINYIQDIDQMTGLLANIEVTITGKNDANLMLLANFNLVEEAEATAAVVLMTAVDLTKLRRVEETSQAQKAEISELQKTLSLREQFSQMLVHDMRSPLTVMRLKLSKLQFMLQDNPKMRRDLEQTLYQTERLEGMVDDLLTMARIENGRLAMAPEEVDLNELVTTRLQSFTEIVKAHRLGLASDISTDPLPVTVDIRLIERVLDNLLTNALKYAPTGSSITIRTSPGDAKEIATISVSDEGKGIPDHLKPMIFDSFHVGETKPQRGEQTGLGLSFCLQAVEAHHGKLLVSDNQPTGAIFTVELPLN